MIRGCYTNSTCSESTAQQGKERLPNQHLHALKTLRRKLTLSLVGVINILVFSSSATANVIGLPTLRGDYLMCPNSKGISKDFWADLWTQDGFDPRNPRFMNGLWDLNTLRRRDKFASLQSISSEVLIGKGASQYSPDLLSALKRKALSGGINVPTSYKSTRVRAMYDDPSDLSYTESITYLLYQFVNSEGKRISIKSDFGSYPELIDNQGRVFSSDGTMGVMGMFFCTEDSVVLRTVQHLRLRNVTNSYGETLELPMIIWIVNAAVQSRQPSSRTQYSF